jgi:hypothetical protein
MLALYRLFSGNQARELPRAEVVLQEASPAKLPRAKRVVLVGNKISPASPVRKDDGARGSDALWELAWQLGGKRAYARVNADDEKATNPGGSAGRAVQRARAVLGPDRRVGGLGAPVPRPERPGGRGIQTQFTLAQVLTESARSSKNCLRADSFRGSRPWRS